MLKKIMAMALTLSFLGALVVVPDALAKRGRQRGCEDNGTDICVPGPHK